MMSMHIHPWKGFRPWERHSLVLMICGVVFVLIGVSYIITEPTRAREQALHFAFEWMPSEGWGAVFILCGVLSIISSRWPPISETWGYTVLSGMSAAWAGFYLVGVLFGESPATNLSGVLSWGVIAFMWWAISGLLNPSDILPKE